MKPEDLVKALRCTFALCGVVGECETCPYYRREYLNDELKEKLGTDTWTSCAVDKVGMDAADQKEIAELREKVPQWISVEDRMPDTVPCDAGTEYSEAVVVWTNGNKAMIAVWDGIDWICPCDFWEAWGEEITHWMPLPEPPKED